MSRTTSATLPRWVVDYLTGLRDGPGDARTRYRRLAGARDLLRDNGWPLARIADGMGISRQAVEQWSGTDADRDGHPDLPMPPPPTPRPTRPHRPPPLEVQPADAARMRELLPLAVQVNGRTPLGSPLREAGKELAALMAKAVGEGVSIQKIADTVGQTRNAVAFRLGRYHYDDCVPQWTVDYVERVRVS